MSTKKKNIFEKMTDALNNATNELETTNSYLYGIGTELADAANTLREISSQLADLLKQGIKVTVDFETFKENLAKQTPKPEEAESPKEAYPEPV